MVQTEVLRGLWKDYKWEGKSRKVPSGSAGLGLSRVAVALSGNEENGSTAICSLFLNPFVYPKIRAAEVQSS